VPAPECATPLRGLWQVPCLVLERIIDWRITRHLSYELQPVPGGLCWFDLICRRGRPVGVHKTIHMEWCQVQYATSKLYLGMGMVDLIKVRRPRDPPCSPLACAGGSPGAAHWPPPSGDPPNRQTVSFVGARWCTSQGFLAHASCLHPAMKRENTLRVMTIPLGA
jgi:hypothetical protein